MTTPVPGDIGVASAVVLTAVGGYIDAYLFLHHHVFAFAQTGNVVLLAIAMVQHQSWTHYLWPLLAYVAGVAAAQGLRAARPTLPRGSILAVMIIQVVAFAALALVPSTARAAVFTVPLSFIGGARMDLFRSAGGHTFVSIATTGNLMRFVQSLGAVLQERSALRWQQVGVSSLVVFAFVGGALAGAAASVALGPAALWGAVALELAAVLLYAFGD